MLSGKIPPGISTYSTSTSIIVPLDSPAPGESAKIIKKQQLFFSLSSPTVSLIIVKVLGSVKPHPPHWGAGRRFQEAPVTMALKIIQNLNREIFFTKTLDTELSHEANIQNIKKIHYIHIFGLLENKQEECYSDIGFRIGWDQHLQERILKTKFSTKCVLARIFGSRIGL